MGDNVRYTESLMFSDRYGSLPVPFPLLNVNFVMTADVNDVTSGVSLLHTFRKESQCAVIKPRIFLSLIELGKAPGYRSEAGYACE